MESLPRHVSAVTPLGGALDGTRPARPRQPRTPREDRACPYCGQADADETHLRAEITALAGELAAANVRHWDADTPDEQVHDIAVKARARARAGLPVPALWAEADTEWYRRRHRRYTRAWKQRTRHADVRAAFDAGGWAAARQAAGLTIRDLARQAGVSETQLTRTETRGDGFGIDATARLFDALGLADLAAALRRTREPCRDPRRYPAQLLTGTRAARLRARRASGVSVPALAAEFGVSESTIGRALARPPAAS